MQIYVKNSKLEGEIVIPPSKSQTLRAILFGALADGESLIYNWLNSPDTESMLDALSSFGARFEKEGERIKVKGLNGKIDFAEDIIDAGNSGIVLRFCTAIGALAPYPVVITGDRSIRHNRPMKPLLSALSALGVKVQSMRGDHFAPVIVHGPMQRGVAHLEGEDSQPVSALIIAGAFAKDPIEINVTNPGEIPWVELTLSWLKWLNIPYRQEGIFRYFLEGRSHYPGFVYKVPGDLSSLAFPLAAALITQSELHLRRVDMDDGQGDKELVQIFQKMGGNIEIDSNSQSLLVKKGNRLQGISVDINRCIDAIPILAVTACFAEGETLLYNGAVARNKESDRIYAMAKELQKMGADIKELPDGLRIRTSRLKGACLDSHLDHRVCLSLAVAALAAEGETIIERAECIDKTYSTFVSDLKGLGANIEI